MQHLGLFKDERCQNFLLWESENEEPLSMRIHKHWSKKENGGFLTGWDDDDNNHINFDEKVNVKYIAKILNPSKKRKNELLGKKNFV